MPIRVFDTDEREWLRKRMFYMDYYVAVTSDGEAESSLYTLSEDGLTLTLKDIGGAWELAYQKEAE